ncbi:MAG TPA: TSUP family transporter [Steroidobacteraceae bacterium]|nr:TSUP family transporter [Steroidobacteraceae bacterium]
MCAAFSAGFVDAIVGGGGLIQLPALLAAYPTASPPVLLGTNKLGSICGTSSAVLRYMRVVRVPWRLLLPAAAVACLASLAGASLVSAVSPALFRPLVPVMLTAVLLYVLRQKDLGARHAPIAFSRRRGLLALAIIGGIGLYDGFFGPGTGSFLMLLFIRLYGFDFLHASAGARTINVATNLGALLFFGLHAEVNWGLGLALGVCNAAGSVLGAHTAVRHGSKFVRLVFIAIVLALIIKTGADAWSR